MFLRDYVKYRDTHIRFGIYRQFRDLMRKAGYSDAVFRSLLEETYERESIYFEELDTEEREERVV